MLPNSNKMMMMMMMINHNPNSYANPDTNLNLNPTRTNSSFPAFTDYRLTIITLKALQKLKQRYVTNNTFKNVQIITNVQKITQNHIFNQLTKVNNSD